MIECTDKTVYLSGKISGDPDFKAKFATAKSILIGRGGKAGH